MAKQPEKRVIGYRRTKLPGTLLEGPMEPIYEGEEDNKTKGRKVVEWRPTKLDGTELAGPLMPIYDDDLPEAPKSAD